jgi:nucleoside-diphosphate-sugar epimerase
MRAIVIRAGDFFGSGRGSWLDLVLAKDIGRDLVTYPGPPDVIHEWAYLPDLAEATVRLAAVRERLSPFEMFVFPSHAVTGEEFARAIAKAVRRRLRVKPMSWWLIHALAPFAALPREISEIGYLWKIPHRIAGAKLEAAIGEVPHTPFDTAVANALRELGVLRN